MKIYNNSRKFPTSSYFERRQVKTQPVTNREPAGQKRALRRDICSPLTVHDSSVGWTFPEGCRLEGLNLGIDS